MNLALFDLDNTLLTGDSDFEWAQFLISKGVVDRELQEAKNIQFYEQYKAGTLDIYGPARSTSTSSSTSSSPR
ncbi:MAG: HAD family hydrolase [Rhodocyclaceae bacterium]|nr:MAG: HAD family hydrolase [Rhodocyclaceae bacterium]